MDDDRDECEDKEWPKEQSLMFNWVARCGLRVKGIHKTIKSR